MLRRCGTSYDSPAAGPELGARHDEGLVRRGRRLRARSLVAAARGIALATTRLIASVARLLRGRRHRSPGLVGLSDQVLADIGMRRADLHAMVYAGAPLSRVKPPRGENVARFDGQCSGRTPARLKLVIDNDELDSAA